MQCVIESGGLRLSGYLVRPESSAPVPGLVLCHGFPAGPGGAATSGQTYPQLADRLSADTGWAVLTFNFRGTGASEGDFSLAGWLDDLRAAIDHLLSTHGVSGVWLAGAGTGGSLALCEAGEDERVRGVATLSARADFGDWASDPASFLDHARTIGLIDEPVVPARLRRLGPRAAGDPPDRPHRQDPAPTGPARPRRRRRRRAPRRRPGAGRRRRRRRRAAGAVRGRPPPPPRPPGRGPHPRLDGAPGRVLTIVLVALTAHAVGTATGSGEGTGRSRRAAPGRRPPGRRTRSATGPRRTGGRRRRACHRRCRA